MKSPTIFFTYIQSSTLFLHVCKISWSPIYVKKNAAYFNMLTKACLFQQLWTIFWTKIVKNPSIFVTYILTSFQYLHAHIILLRSHFYNKNDNEVSMLVTNCYLFQRAYSLPPVLNVFFYLWFQYPQFRLNTIMHWQTYLLKHFFLQHYGPWKSKILILHFLFCQFWTTFTTKLMKRAAIFITCIQIAFQIVQV